MTDEAAEARVREALTELQQYLSDAVAPLVVADSVRLLLRCPAEVVAGEIHAWTTAQYRGARAAAPVSDYLFHAARKLHVLGEYRLLPADAFAAWLEELKVALLAYCPDDDRQRLGLAMERLDDSQSTTFAPPVTILHRQAGSEAPPTFADVPASPAEVAGENRRLAALVHRLEQLAAAAADGARAAPAGVGSELLAAAADRSRDAAEFRQFRERLQQEGVGVAPEDVIRYLARSLPPWGVLPPAAVGGERPALAGVAETMRRLVAFEEDPQEGAKRFQELVRAAVEEVNTGAVGRAATMLDLADRLVAERRVDSAVALACRERAHEGLDTGRLRKLAEDELSQPVLRRVLAFFPVFSPAALCTALQGEERRDRRRFLLALLETHGDAARVEAVRRLGESVAAFGDRDAFFQRNLLYLLRRLPRPGDTVDEQELALLCLLSDPARPLPVAKEAIAALAAARHEKAEQTLIARLAEIEGRLSHPAEPGHSVADLLTLLDRVVFALARRGSQAAARAVVQHGLKRQPALGDTLARMSCLAGQDLSADPELVARLVRTLALEIPRRVLGILIPKRGADLVSLITTVSSTRAPEVRAVLADVARRFPGQESGLAAGRALSEICAPPPPAEPPPRTLAGDLELFGIPTLLQNLAASDASGLLTLKDEGGEAFGRAILRGGKLVACRVGPLRGLEALCQVIEDPRPGTFVFLSPHEAADEDAVDLAPPQDILPMVFEGMRRYDELVQARTLVADDAVLRHTGVRPTRLRDEPDKALLATLWARITSGRPARECEAGLAADSYRLRRAVAHWVEEGALEVV